MERSIFPTIIFYGEFLKYTKVTRKAIAKCRLVLRGAEQKSNKNFEECLMTPSTVRYSFNLFETSVKCLIS